MFKLRFGYLISGFATGLVLLLSFIGSLPDGKLHIVFCDVGQGDSAYIRFPDGRDMIIDGGPNDAILGCLGKHMPFWDRSLNVVLMTHPQKDHMQGLISVFERYRVDYFVRSDIDNTTESYQKLKKIVADKKISVKLARQGENIRIGQAGLSFVWPSAEQIAKGKTASQEAALQTASGRAVLGVSVGDLNDYSLVLWLRYGSFDTLFTGDADMHVEGNYTDSPLADNQVEVLKVPHHGSKTGMTKEFVEWLKPELAIISVGKNSYGHPSQEAIALLQSVGSRILRTDKEGDIEVISDGKGWHVTNN